MAERDTTFYIWEQVWLCKIPQLQTTSVDYLKFFGTPTTFDSQFDKDLSKQWIDTALTIAKMVEYHREGVPIRITKYNDVKMIYEHIENHLQAWANNLKNNLNIGDAPIEDLLAMDDFAAAVYPMARPLYEGQAHASSFMRAVEKLGFGGFNTTMRGPVVTPDEKPAQRPDVRDVFKNVKNGFNRWT